MNNDCDSNLLPVAISLPRNLTLSEKTTTSGESRKSQCDRELFNQPITDHKSPATGFHTTPSRDAGTTASHSPETWQTPPPVSSPDYASPSPR